MKKNVPLKDYTTFRVGGNASFFDEPKTIEDIKKSISWARDNKINYLVLGGGSNIVFPDTGYDGLIIKPAFNSIRIEGDTVNVGASVSLRNLIEQTLQTGLTGLEFAAGIPGSVGGAIRGNAGTYGIGIGDVTTKVHIITNDLMDKYLTHDECSFSYRHSIFKLRNDLVFSAYLNLTRGDVAESKRIIHERIEKRLTNHPTEPSAGCIFKNVEFSKVNTSDLIQRGLEIKQFETFKKIPAGFLIDSLDLKEMQIGGAKISSKHANYIINTGEATYENIITLTSLIKQKVRDAYGIQLEEEVQIVS